MAMSLTNGDRLKDERLSGRQKAFKALESLLSAAETTGLTGEGYVRIRFNNGGPAQSRFLVEQKPE